MSSSAWRKHTRALHVELNDESKDARRPLTLPPGPLQNVVASVGAWHAAG